MRRFSLALLSAVALAAPAAAQQAAPPNSAAPDGALIYKRCAACHLPTGKGIPGAFPPLDQEVADFARAPDGRAYLAHVLLFGLTGEIVHGGKTYRGTMPAQAGLSDADVAAVLNHVMTTIIQAKPEVAPFTAAEIATARADKVNRAPAQVAALRRDLIGKLKAEK
jgi:mono/diheme cytochrome c family protein